MKVKRTLAAIAAVLAISSASAFAVTSSDKESPQQFVEKVSLSLAKGQTPSYERHVREQFGSDWAYVVGGCSKINQGIVFGIPFGFGSAPQKLNEIRIGEEALYLFAQYGVGGLEYGEQKFGHYEKAIETASAILLRLSNSDAARLAYLLAEPVQIASWQKSGTKSDYTIAFMMSAIASDVNLSSNDPVVQSRNLVETFIIRSKDYKENYGAKATPLVDLLVEALFTGNEAGFFSVLANSPADVADMKKWCVAAGAIK